MSWLLRLLALVAAFHLLRWLWQWFWRGRANRVFAGSRRAAATPVRRGIIQRDPLCGTYVDVELSVKDQVAGDTLHFCSERCRSAYRARLSHEPDGQPRPAPEVPKAH